MPRNVRTARGDIVDFDAVVIKQSIAQAPMNIEVQRRRDFIDSKEGKPRGKKNVQAPAPGTDGTAKVHPDTFVTNAPTKTTVVNTESAVKVDKKDLVEDFDSNVPSVKSKTTVEAVPVIPDRK